VCGVCVVRVLRARMGFWGSCARPRLGVFVFFVRVGHNFSVNGRRMRSHPGNMFAARPRMSGYPKPCVMMGMCVCSVAGPCACPGWWLWTRRGAAQVPLRCSTVRRRHPRGGGGLGKRPCDAVRQALVTYAPFLALWQLCSIPGPNHGVHHAHSSAAAAAATTTFVQFPLVQPHLTPRTSQR
jgi:hypothetical protein